MLIDFKSLNELLLKYVWPDWNKGNYILNLGDVLMCDPVDEEEEKEQEKGRYNPFSGKTPDMLRKIFRGVVPMSKADALKVYIHFEADRLIDQIDSLLDVARDLLIDNLKFYGVKTTAKTVGQDIASLIEEHLKQFAQTNQSQEWQAMKVVEPQNAKPIAADIKMLHMGNISLPLLPQSNSKTYSVRITAIVPKETNKFQDFAAFYSHLKFLGKAATMQISDMIIYSNSGEVVDEYHSAEKNSATIEFPKVYMMIPEHMPRLTDQTVGKVTIEPEFIYRDLELLDEKGNIIVASRRYKIERARHNGITTTTFVDQDGPPETTVNYFIKYDDTKQTVVDAGVKLHRVSDTLMACVDYYQIKERMASSKTALCRVIDYQIDLFKVGVQVRTGSKKKARDEAQKYKELFQKMVFLESFYKTKFVFPEIVTPFEAKSVFMLYDLANKGVAKSPLYRLNLESPSDIDDPNKSRVIFAELNDLEIMGATFKCAGRGYVAVNFIDEIKESDQGYYVDITKSYVYDESMTTLSQEEIVHNFQKGKLII